METLVVSAQPYRGNKSQISDQFGSSPSIGFKEISCRTFQSGSAVLLPTFTIPDYNSPPVTKKLSNFYQSSPSVYSPSENHKYAQNSRKSSAIPIPKLSDTVYNDEFCYSELWAGPAFSNSPPPSSLPIPIFSFKEKRNVSVDLPNSASGIMINAFAKSAPSSPRRGLYSPANDFFHSTASATDNLRRILHLDVVDD